MRNGLRTCLAATAATMLVAGPAQAADGEKTFSGQTSQDRRVTMLVGANGVIKGIDLPFKARCERSGESFSVPHFAFVQPMDRADANGFFDHGSVTNRVKGGFRVTSTFTLAGLRVAEQAYGGTMKARITVRKGGKVVDRCGADTTWKATLR